MGIFIKAGTGPKGEIFFRLGLSDCDCVLESGIGHIFLKAGIGPMGEFFLRLGPVPWEIFS